jgi:hypothetical protein
VCVSPTGTVEIPPRKSCSTVTSASGQRARAVKWGVWQDGLTHPRLEGVITGRRGLGEGPDGGRGMKPQAAATPAPLWRALACMAWEFSGRLSRKLLCDSLTMSLKFATKYRHDSAGVGRCLSGQRRESAPHGRCKSLNRASHSALSPACWTSRQPRNSWGVSDHRDLWPCAVTA